MGVFDRLVVLAIFLGVDQRTLLGAKMFNRMKERAKFTDKDPTFKVRYIGHMETFLGSGRGCTTTLVQRLWDNSEDEEFLRKVKIRLTVSGIHMKYMDKKREPEKLFVIENISFCNVDTPVNDRIFSWIYREADDKQFKCHAVVCNSTETAKTMSIVLSRAFQIAYKEWKSKQTKLFRDKPIRTPRSVSMNTEPVTRKSDHLTRHQSDGMIRSLYTPSETNGHMVEPNDQVFVSDHKLADDEKIVNGKIMKEEDTKIERF